MTSVLIGLLLFGSVLAVALAFAWQERRRFMERSVVYGIEDALDYIVRRLSPEIAGEVRRADVRRILEWEMRYLQDPDLREGHEAVVGGLDAAEYAQEQAYAHGHAYEPAAIIEILDLQAEYLASIGAVGEVVDPDESRPIIERYEESG